MSNQAAVRATRAVLIVAFLALITLVAWSPQQFVFDESCYANYVPLLHQFGFTAKFMNALTGTAGPLYGFVHVFFEPWTQLRPVRMRFINVLLLVTVVGILGFWSKQQKLSDYEVLGGSVLVVPMTWVLAGLALTEMPALVFITLSLYLQLKGMQCLDRGRSVLGWFLASAIFFGIAVWGRQSYLPLSGVPLLVAVMERKLRMPALIFFGAAIAIALPLFIIWRGLTPPAASMESSLSPINGIISLGYTGICFLILAPRLPQTSRALTRILIGSVALTVAANAFLGVFAFYPGRSVANRYLSPSAVSAYGNLCGSLLLSCGVVFLFFSLRIIWAGRNDPTRLTINAGLLCVAASPAFIASQYSSRYTAMSLPYLILAAQPWREWRLKTVIVAVAGCGLGSLILVSYLKEITPTCPGVQNSARLSLLSFPPEPGRPVCARASRNG